MTAQVRPRPAWEAVDLGFMMLQRWYRPVIRSWVLFTLPVFIVINSLLYDHPFLAGLAFWWLLPIFDRIPLQVLSRALFAEQLSSRDILRDWRGIFLPHLVKMLTFYRLDFMRSYNLPVWQLEGLKGNARVQRSRVLKKLQSSNALGLGFMCICIEIIIYFTIYGIILLFLPDSFDHELTSALYGQGKAWWGGPLANGFLYLTFLIVEPFYVAGGFSLYINRRTELEGWDIEVAFRQLAQRIAPRLRQILVPVAFALLLPAVALHAPVVKAAAGTGQPTITSAGTSNKATDKTANTLVPDNAPVKPAVSGELPDTSPTNNAVAKNAIKKILQEKAFHDKEKVSGWKLRHPLKTSKSSNPNASQFNWLEQLGNGFAAVGQLLLWVVVAALVIGAIYLLVKWLPASADGGQSRKKNPPAPKSLFGLDITPESLPEDVGATALQLWRAGKFTEALSLLYRGALMTLVHRDGINLRGSSTEGDCMRIVARHKDRVSESTREFFGQLTLQWQIIAYAHRRPDDKLVTDLCQSWTSHFGVAA